MTLQKPNAAAQQLGAQLTNAAQMIAARQRFTTEITKVLQNIIDRSKPDAATDATKDGSDGRTTTEKSLQATIRRAAFEFRF
jgi:hypothetical protein